MIKTKKQTTIFWMLCALSAPLLSSCLPARPSTDYSVGHELVYKLFLQQNVLLAESGVPEISKNAVLLNMRSKKMISIVDGCNAYYFFKYITDSKHTELLNDSWEAFFYKSLESAEMLRYEKNKNILKCFYFDGVSEREIDAARALKIKEGWGL